MRILKSTWDLVDSVKNRPQINFRKSRWLFRRLGTKKRLAIQTPDWCIWNCFYPILLKIHESAFFIWNHRNTRIEFCETFSFIQPLCNLLLHTSILLKKIHTPDFFSVVGCKLLNKWIMFYQFYSRERIFIQMNKKTKKYFSLFLIILFFLVGGEKGGMFFANNWCP